MRLRWECGIHAGPGGVEGQDHGSFFRCQTAPRKYSYMLGGIVSSCSLAMCLRTVSEYRKLSPQMRQCHWSRAKTYGRHSELFGSSLRSGIFASFPAIGLQRPYIWSPHLIFEPSAGGCSSVLRPSPPAEKATARKGETAREGSRHPTAIEGG